MDIAILVILGYEEIGLSELFDHADVVPRHPGAFRAPTTSSRARGGVRRTPDESLMRIEELSVVVRSRTMSECCDLAVAMLRQYWLQLLVLTAISVMPICFAVVLLVSPLFGETTWIYFFCY